MELKQYQIDALAALRRFFEEARIAGAKSAYEAITKEPEYADRLGAYGGDYAIPLEELPSVPYVCLRLPTGGGKTMLGAYAVHIARDAWIEKDCPLVLWLAPTNTIRRQTVDALKNTSHPYRQALDEAFEGRVRVFDIANFAEIRPQDIRDYCCIVAGTIQALRVASTEGRKVYAHNENLESHFSGVSPTTPSLEAHEHGGVKFSFANLMHLHRPLMIVDEAHNAVTDLTREMQARVNPCAIIEFTATPQPNSNILYSVTAQELKREEMIKLPIMLSEYETWQNAVNGAIARRAQLAKTAKNDADHIRPIVLFQAQRKNQEVTVAALKKHLIEVEQVPENAIAIATGNQRELDGINLFDSQCPIECVITVEALKEGWDCSFAYVFCSVSRIQNSRNIEQLFGRVLRMPYAKRRKDSQLNKAYACVSEPSFGEAARALVDKLVTMGFEEEEAQENIQAPLPGLDDSDLFDLSEKSKPKFTYTLPAEPEILLTLKNMESKNLTIKETDDGNIDLAYIGAMDDNFEEVISAMLEKTERKVFAEAVEKHQKEIKSRLSPAERGEKLEIPGLVVEIQGKLELANTDALIEDHEWSLLDYPGKLNEQEFTIRETANSFEIYLDEKQIRYHFTREEERLFLDVNVKGWTPKGLVLWLDREVRQRDIGQGEMIKWLSNLTQYLIHERNMTISALMRCKFLLARRVKNKLADIRQKERREVYQRCIIAPASKAEVSFEHTFTFKESMYSGQKLYRGAWRPQKHFLGSDHVPAFDGTENGEEAQCAQVIDSLPEVKHWIRNVASHPESFWLPLANGKFFPDFAAQLNDGRFVIAEYKGEMERRSDTMEKEAIGELWERKSNGKCLFIIVRVEIDGRDMRRQLAQKLQTG